MGEKYRADSTPMGVARMTRADNAGLLRQTDLYDMASTSDAVIEPNALSRVTPKAVHPHWMSTRVLFAVCAISIIAQGMLMVVDRQATFTCNVLIALQFLLAAAGCLRCASRQNSETRALWILVAAGFFLSIAGQIEDTYDFVMKV